MEIMKMVKFLVFNVILPLFDIGTDVQAFFLYLFYYNHPNWAFLTLFWIFNPFFVQLFKFVFILYFTKKADWGNLFLHFPFVIPFKNCWHAYQLHKLDFGEGGGKSWAKAEEIHREVAKTSLSESYLAHPLSSLSIRHTTQKLLAGY